MEKERSTAAEVGWQHCNFANNAGHTPSRFISMMLLTSLFFSMHFLMYGMILTQSCLRSRSVMSAYAFCIDYFEFSIFVMYWGSSM